MDNLDYHKDCGWFRKYCISKALNYLKSAEYAGRYRDDGILSIALNPGNLDSELWRSQPYVIAKILKSFFLHAPIMGAYIELFAGLLPEVTMKRAGGWIVPWGRFMNARNDLQDAAKTKAEGRSGIAKAFREWNEEQVRPCL
jgi:retinol dehydrogenase 12